MSKQNEITEDKAQATEFSRRRSIPGCEARIMSTARSQDVVLTCLGVEIGSMTKLFKRGKVVSVLYVLPPLDRLNALLALPVAR